MDFGSALERSAALRSKVSAMERALAANPDDKGLRITLLSARRLAERAEAELTAVAQQADVDLCRYRVIRPEDHFYAALSVSESIIAYQELFTALYDFVRNGPKMTASYSKEVRANTVLNIAYTFPGSLGVLLAIRNDRDMFGHGEFDRVLNALSQVSELKTKEDVRTVGQQMGLNVVRNVFRWAEKNWKSEFSVDVQWARSDSVVKGEHVPRRQFLRLVTLIEQTSDEVPKDIDIEGSLVGLHVLSETFSLVSHGESYSGRLAKGFHKRQYKVPGVYKAKIKMKTTVKYATEATSTTYELLTLEEV